MSLHIINQKYIYNTGFKLRSAGVGIGKFLKGWCCRKNEGSGTMGTLFKVGSWRREGGVAAVETELRH